MSPTCSGDIPKISELGNIDSIEEYGTDYFTVPSSVCGAPSLSIPGKQFSTSVKVWGNFGEDFKMLEIAKSLSRVINNV